MNDASVFDIVLFGFRNDVARARTLAYLDKVPPSPAGPSHIAPDTALPQRLFAALQRPQAEPLRDALEALGAQVALVLVVPLHPWLPAAEDPPDLTHDGRPARSLTPLVSVSAMLIGGAILLGWAAYFARTTRPASHSHTGSAHHQAATDDIAQGQPEPPAAVRFNTDAVHFAQAGQFREAADRLRAALQLAPDDPTLTRNLQMVLFNWGAADLAAAKLDDAAEHLQQAADLGERADVLRGLGVAYLRQANYTQAGPTLERALELAPADATVMLALSETYLHQDKRPQALDLLQRAKNAGAIGPDLDKRVEQLSREVDAEWDFVQLESVHFRASFADDDDRSAVSTVLDAFEDAYYSVGAKFDYYPDSRTPIVLYTQQDFHSVTRTPDWAGGAFDGRIKLPVRGLTANDPNLPRTARHEYAHSIITRVSNGRCPVWLNEGLAVWTEETAEGERQTWAEAKIADQELYTLDQLRDSFTRLPAERAEVAYAESYLAVRNLVDRYGARKIPALLSALATAPDVSDAFASVYPGDLAGFQQQLLRQLGG